MCCINKMVEKKNYANKSIHQQTKQNPTILICFHRFILLIRRNHFNNQKIAVLYREFLGTIGFPSGSDPLGVLVGRNAILSRRTIGFQESAEIGMLIESICNK